MEKSIITTFILAILGIFVGFFLGLYLPEARPTANVLIFGGFIFLVITLALIIISAVSTTVGERKSERRS